MPPILKIRNLRKPENLERRTQVYRRHTGKCLSGKWGHRRHGEENQKQKSRPAVLSKIPIFDALEQSPRVAPMSQYRRGIRFPMLILFGIAEGKCDLPTVCVFFGATFDHHFGTFWTPPTNVRDAEGLKIETIFLIKKPPFFASVFKANPEWYGVFAEAPLEFPEALVWGIFWNNSRKYTAMRPIGTRWRSAKFQNFVSNFLKQFWRFPDTTAFFFHSPYRRLFHRSVD